jgi:hypothetical protein
VSGCDGIGDSMTDDLSHSRHAHDAAIDSGTSLPDVTDSSSSDTLDATMPTDAPDASVPPDSAVVPHKLLLEWQGGNSSHPQSIHDQIAYLDTLPFDGAGVNSDTGWHLMDNVPRSYTTIYNEFLPLRGLPATHFRHFYAEVFIRINPSDQGPDFYDDWSTIVANWGNLATALRDVGVEGVFIDNEDYAGNRWEYPSGVRYPSHTLAEYQAQARQRGREIMAAMVAAFPGISVMLFHGPYTGCVPIPILNQGNLGPLSGPFEMGMLEARGSSAHFIDGGEIYANRSVDDFQSSYQFRRYDIANNTTACSFIPATLRPSWSSTVEVAFSVYNRPTGSLPMTASIFQTTLENALQRTDRIVWQYSEGVDWFTPGGIGADWIAAARAARATVP